MAKKVLTEAELACLLEVPTTVADAEMILKRNQRMLRLLKARQAGRVEYGCPHCLAAGGNENILGNCDICKYPSDTGPKRSRCCYYSFGGVSFDYNDVQRYINLRAHDASVYSPRAHEDCDKAITWVKGHIEWAREVIRRARKAKKPRPNSARRANPG